MVLEESAAPLLDIWKVKNLKWYCILSCECWTLLKIVDFSDIQEDT